MIISINICTFLSPNVKPETAAPRKSLLSTRYAEHMVPVRPQRRVAIHFPNTSSFCLTSLIELCRRSFQFCLSAVRAGLFVTWPAFSLTEPFASCILPSISSLVPLFLGFLLKSLLTLCRFHQHTARKAQQEWKA